MMTFYEFVKKAEVLNPDADSYGARVTSVHKDKHREDKIHKVRLNQLTPNEPGKFDDATHESSKAIHSYVKDIHKKKHIEPITVHHINGGYRILDGHHRVEAHIRAGKKHINARVISGHRIKPVDSLD